MPSLHETIELSESLQNALSNHKDAPSLHVLKEHGMTLLTRRMSCVRSLSTSFRVYSRSRMAEPLPLLALHRCFETFSNLTSPSIQLNREPFGPVRGGRWVTTPIEPVELAEDGTFPPIEKISLSGYHPAEAEWKHWKEKFLWSQLKSLSLGPTQTHDFLGPIVGHVQNLSSFATSAYNGSELYAHPELESFLTSFDTLKCLTVKGYSLSIGAVSHHSSLERLILHTLQTREKERHTPGEI